MQPVSNGTDSTANLRAQLRSATMAAHDLLDAATRAASGWQTRADYARFLTMQHAARAPVEGWLAAHAPADLRPPPQTPLIAADLTKLGEAMPAPAPLFTLGRTSAGHALGVAWVLAGSALGNRAIARQVARIGCGAWPSEFLDDGAMLDFWQGLRARIERPAHAEEAAGASEAAAAVFAHFLTATADSAARESVSA
ncbi:MAG TPA: biliverdin-producing heme oxygenase [Erythrobacter sp.]|nr:biliverdin-producing heme oxygenase [Erythrobacter sp.]